MAISEAAANDAPTLELSGGTRFRGKACVHGDVSGQDEEGDPDQQMGASVDVLGCFRVGLRAGCKETPQDHQGRGDFDQAVDAEGHQGCAAGDCSGTDRDDCLCDVPQGSEPLQTQGSAV
jgi:hypothetical protein